MRVVMHTVFASISDGSLQLYDVYISKCACLSSRSLVLSSLLISESQESSFPGEIRVK